MIAQHKLAHYYELQETVCIVHDYWATISVHTNN